MTLLAGHRQDTKFVIDHINELKLYAKVIWFGDNLRHLTRALYDQNIRKPVAERKSFIVVHWSPSEMIDIDIEYETIAMPKCEQFSSEESKNSMCKYELTPILMYCSKELKDASAVYHVFSIVNFNQTNEKYLLQLYNNMTDVEAPPDNSLDDFKSVVNRGGEKDQIYNEIACKFIRENQEMSKQIEQLSLRMANMSKPKVYIGGIYPKLEEAENEHKGKPINCDSFFIKYK